MRRSRLPIWRILVALFFVGVGCAGIWTVIRANGYQILTSPVRVVKTGLISLRVHPDQEINIYLNGILQPPHKVDFTDLTPGRYTILITKPNFQNWEQTVNLTAGQAITNRDVTLYYTHPLITKVDDPTQIKQYAALVDNPSRYKRQIEVIGNEVWADDQLVTRYSSQVTEAMWAPGETHVLILVNNQLHSVELTQNTDTILFSLPEAKNVRYAPIAGGQKILVGADDQLFIYTVTEPYSLIPLPSF